MAFVTSTEVHDASFPGGAPPPKHPTPTQLPDDHLLPECHPMPAALRPGAVLAQELAHTPARAKTCPAAHRRPPPIEAYTALGVPKPKVLAAAF
ncbi:hypothetical protein CKAH01_18164 [Colletotrichum kahawae]|uniref:Uncharacterized protein n=1 Tax=Colletotrichum kahawae TaxID=34407 RepID=A0AAD9Y9V7_COLKA|nr:hypothetical protein CKAH01_18164 [Colletotrichum kahawae]